jgi:hypothetical protein
MTKRDDAATVDLKVRMKEPLRAAIESAAQQHGISMNAEAVARLDQSFDRGDLLPEVMALAYGREVAGILMLMGRAMASTGPHAGFLGSPTIEGSQRWFSDPYAYDQAARAAHRVLEALRPEGEIAPPGTLQGIGDVIPDLANVADNLGAGFANGILDGVVGRGATAKVQREGQTIADLLGDMAERIAPKHDGSGKNAR